MATQGRMAALLAAVMLLVCLCTTNAQSPASAPTPATTSPSPAPAPTCEFSLLSECQTFVFNDTVASPSQTCCKNLASVVQTIPSCVCNLNISQYTSHTVDRANTLLSNCSVTYSFAICNSPTPSPSPTPTPSPAPSPSPASAPSPSSESPSPSTLDTSSPPTPSDSSPSPSSKDASGAMSFAPSMLFFASAVAATLLRIA